jgi:hypothetical protein
LGILIGIAALVVIFIGGYGVWLASETDQMPWQAEPTRIVVEPFSGIPGYGNADATPTP